MPKQEGAEEYDGYVVPEPRQLTKEEAEMLEKRIQALRERALKANQKSRTSVDD